MPMIILSSAVTYGTSRSALLIILRESRNTGQPRVRALSWGMESAHLLHVCIVQGAQNVRCGGAILASGGDNAQMFVYCDVLNRAQPGVPPALAAKRVAEAADSHCTSSTLLPRSPCPKRLRAVRQFPRRTIVQANCMLAFLPAGPIDARWHETRPLPASQSRNTEAAWMWSLHPLSVERNVEGPEVMKGQGRVQVRRCEPQGCGNRSRSARERC